MTIFANRSRMRARAMHQDLLAQVADSEHEEATVRRVLGVTGPGTLHILPSCKGGPCCQGRKACPMPQACHVPDPKDEDQSQGAGWRVYAALLGIPAFVLALGAAAVFWR